MTININEAWCSNTEPLTIATYDGSGEATHPDVYDAGAGQTWAGHRYWLALTPYPNNNVELENPCIYYSDDGIAWTGIAANPIDLPDTKHRSDPDLIRVGATMYCYYRAMNGSDDLMWQKSTDGETWTDKTVAIAALHSTLSPALVEYNGGYQMYTIHYVGESARVMQKRTAANIEGPWSEPVTVSTANPGAGNLWHMDILNDGGTLYCLMNVNTTTAAGLYLGVSTDGGDTWTFADAPVLAPRSNLTTYWDHAEIYRSTFVRRDYGFDVWYAGHDNIAGVYEWHIAKTRIVMFDPDVNLKHLYILIQNQTGLASYERTNLWGIVSKIGNLNTDARYKNHNRGVDAETRIYEARVNTDYLSADLLKEQLAIVASIDPATITVTTTTESYGGGSSTKHVFDVGGVAKMTVIIFGTLAATWAQSHAEAYGYVY